MTTCIILHNMIEISNNIEIKFEVLLLKKNALKLQIQSFANFQINCKYKKRKIPKGL